ncbi:uncharacterized protein LOC117341453 [Pecten maximus]|uniref:uncharacterized protein LOC117341453 n=1 Tax=Pecten maximus TaxID=6579 RepID=UPI001458D0B5|nr:uncharacterized protein LOC117341453 [Pecten maximus]
MWTIECTDSSSVANSIVTSNERMIGHTVGILCSDGFVQSGSLKKTCLGNGQWTNVNTVCIDCGDITHYTDYNKARDHCLSVGQNLLHADNASPSLLNIDNGRCVTCPDDLVADQFTRYLEDDCVPDINYKDHTYCNCRFTTAVPGMKVRIQTVFLDLEDGYDFLWMFDGKIIAKALFQK